MKVIITGATGMVGEGVMHECILDERVTDILLVSRKKYSTDSSKVKQLIVKELTDIKKHTDEITGYDACYFCMGVSSVGMKEDQYTKLTYDLTLGFAQTLAEVNKDMTFTYVSGVGTDSTEKGKSMWARVKGKTENDLIALPFKAVFAFRPGGIKPTKGLKNTYTSYKVLAPLVSFLNWAMPKYMCSLADIGKAMINVTEQGYHRPQIEVKDIRKLANN